MADVEIVEVEKQVVVFQTPITMQVIGGLLCLLLFGGAGVWTWASNEVAYQAGLENGTAVPEEIPVRVWEAIMRAVHVAPCDVDPYDLAAISWKESHHGALFSGSSVLSDGMVVPPMVRWDVADYSWSAMQIQEYNVRSDGLDGNGDGKVEVAGDRQNIDDSYATAANHLCKSKGYSRENREAAIKGYNGDGAAAEAYKQDVLALSAKYKAALKGGTSPEQTDAKATWRFIGARARDVWMQGQGTGAAWTYMDAGVRPLLDWWDPKGDRRVRKAAKDAKEDAEIVDRCGAKIRADVADSWCRLVDAAKKDGVTIRVGPNGSFRSADQQREMRRLNGCPDYTSPSSTCLIPTAPVGSSEHEHGRAVDVNSEAIPWMLENACTFGWFNLGMPGQCGYGGLEDWHYSPSGR